MDDRIRPEFRIVGIVVFVVLVAASVLLWLLPGETGKPSDELLEPARFAWPVKPEMTAGFMGSCYGAGAYFFWHVSWGRSWHAVAAYFPGISAFATLMGVSTFLHWDRFNHDHVSFFAWFVLYVTTPVLVPLLFLRNRGADPGPTATGVRVEVPRAVRVGTGAAGAALLVVVAFLYLTPSTAADAWPWPLTPLTSRVVAAFLAAVAITGLVLWREPRWSAWKVNVRAATVSAVLLLGASARAWDEFDTSEPAAYGFVAMLALLLAGTIVLDRRMERTPAPAPSAGT